METMLMSRLAFRITGLLFLLACLLAIGIGVAVCFCSWEAEKTLHAHYLVMDVLYSHVQEKGRWPSNWEDMKGTKPTGDYAFWKWPEDCERLKERIAVKFDLRDEDVYSMTPESFDLVQQKGSHFIIYESEIARLLELIKERIGRNPILPRC
jgi:hypothetical protein